MSVNLRGCRRKFFSAALIVIILQFVAPKVQAISVDTLPKRVRMGELRVGYLAGLDQTFLGDGKLYDLGDVRSISFDASTLARVNDRAQALVAALDVFGSRDLGSKINLGTLFVATQPEVRYTAPVLAYGVNERWTLGVGIPVVRYSNRISLSSGASNLDFYKRQFEGRINREMDEVLNVDLVSEARKVVASKGYRPIENRDQTFIGDIQIALLHRLPNIGSWRFLHRVNFTLPTGPKDDPNDLMALNAFSRTSIGNHLVAARQLSSRWTVLPYANVTVPLPDRTLRRVPKDELDTLPDPESTQELSRQLGWSAGLGGDVRWTANRRWSVLVGAETLIKTSDRYKGTGRTDLLEKNSDQAAAKSRAGVEYSTVDDYLKRRAIVPGKLSLIASDTFWGRNIERQFLTELSAAVFF